MSTKFTTAPFKQVLSYPFKDERWKSKVLIGVLIYLGNFIIPILPALIISGYFYQIMHRILVGDGETHLPEWDDWGKLIGDGWRIFCVRILYQLPGLVLFLIGAGMYFAIIIGITLVDSGSSEIAIPFILIFALIMFASFAIGTVLIILASIVTPVAVCNAVKHDTFKAGFRFSEWWQVLKANFGGFIIAIMLIYGVSMIVGVIGQLFYLTMICCALMYVVIFIGSFYLGLIYAALIPLVYREGLEKLEKQAD